MLSDKKITVKFGHTNISIFVGDITNQSTEVIVNAANSMLRGGGGVDGAIHRAAGHELLDELSKNYDYCAPGDLVVTNSYKLKKFGVIKIFHTVGPIWKGGKTNESKVLVSCYKSCLKSLKDLKLKSISFPAISTGIYGYPKEKAASIALRTIISSIKKEYFNEFDEICFVLFSHNDFQIYKKTLNANMMSK